MYLDTYVNCPNQLRYQGPTFNNHNEKEFPICYTVSLSLYNIININWEVTNISYYVTVTYILS